MKSVEICLCIVFNHIYEANVPILREIYGKRFSKIVFLMPFYRGTDPDVFPYYASSFYFQLSVTQNIGALRRIHASHYVFIADDLVLHPDIDETNVLSRLCAGIDTVSICLLHDPIGPSGADWQRRFDIARLAENAAGVEWNGLLPEYGHMVERIKRLQVTHMVDITRFCDQLTRLGHELPDTRPLIVTPAYPCVAGYSDIFVVPGNLLEDFAHYAGITGAMNLFVEVAVPTVSLMVSERLTFLPCIIFQPGMSDADIAGNGILFWGDEIGQLSAACDSKLSNAFTGVRSNALFIHPIKLSAWR